MDEPFLPFAYTEICDNSVTTMIRMRPFLLILSFWCFAAHATNPIDSKVYFSPLDRLDEKVIALIEKETKSIHAAVYCLSHLGIAKALIAAKDRGVAVEIIVDAFSFKGGGSVLKLVKAGVPIYVWEVKTEPKGKRSPLMHHKFCIFGGEVVWTGSFNFTHLASLSNRENAVILNDLATVRRFEEEFQKIKREECHRFK